MKRKIAIGMLCIATPAGAEQYHFSATATLGSQITYDRNISRIGDPPSTIHTGDAFKLSFDYDTASLTAPFPPSDPTVQFYSGLLSNYAISAGHYSGPSFNVGGPGGQIQLWNNHIVETSPNDLFSITSSITNRTSESPVSFGQYIINEYVTLDNIDLTALVRSSTSINEYEPLNSYVYKSGYLTYLDPYSYQQTQFTLNNIQTTLTPLSAVPEPTSWALMLAGFGLAGVGLRRRNSVACSI